MRGNKLLVFCVIVQMCTLVYTYVQFKQDLSDAFNKGYQKGIYSVDAKELLKRDGVNSVCYSWWFKMDHKDRKLEKL